MKLPRDGREYANWAISGAPTGASFEVQFIFPDGTETDWTAIETVSQSQVRALVAGPDIDNDGGVTLSLGTNNAYLRLTDTPEVVIRYGGAIYVS